MQSINTPQEFEETEEVSVADIFYKYLSYWPLFLLLLVIFIAGAWIYLRYTVPIYETTATLLIKDDKTSNAGTDLIDALDLFGSQKNVENEVEVLQSKTLMQEVVKNLHLYAPVFTKGRVLTQSAYLKSPVVIEAKYPDSLIGSDNDKIEFKFNDISNTITVNKKTIFLNQWDSTAYGILKFLPNKYYKKPDSINESIEYYFSVGTVKAIANSILKRVGISPASQQSTVIDLSIKDEVPKRGQDILNELLSVYDKAAIEDKNVLAANTLKFINERLGFVEKDLDSVERALQRFKASNKITDISAQGQIYLQTVAGNDQKISDVNVQLAMLEQVEKYVQNKGELGGIVPSTLSGAAPVLTGLLQKLSDLELQYTQIKKIVPENNPSAIALRDGIQKLKPQILENIKSQRSNLEAGLADLTSTNNQYASMLKTIPEKERELLGISRQQAIKNNIYTFLLQKKEETALSFASAVADSRVIDYAESSDIPVSPKTKLIYLATILSAIFVGVLFIYMKELLTRTVQQRSDIEKYTHIPFLGEVNYDRSKTPFVISEGKRSFIAEQFRQLRTSLGYMGIDEIHKRILLTSSISGEGKSFIAINLGISFALMGKKVALLEFDLRKPKLSEQFNITQKEGLSNYLVGKMSAGDIIKPTSFENLSLIPAGPIPPNPSELISNGKLAELLSYLDNSFDYIIIDTAPVNPVTDAYLISPLTNVTLFVIRHDYTPKIFLQKLEQRDKISSLKNPAIIYNGIRGKGINKYGYGYGYGYGYTEEG
jgi:capsular exopolysaccharide synthesis family protein